MPRLIDYLPVDNGPWIYEMKFDGYRMQTHLQNGIANLFTRNALNWSNKFPHTLNALEALNAKNAILDGEIVALDDEGKSHFQKLQNSIKNKEDKNLRYYIFDLLYLNGRDLRELPLLERKALLKELLQDAPSNLIMSEHITENGEAFYEVSCEHKLEGVISKLADSPYRSGRNDLWVKTKCTNRQEFVIGGWTDPKGGRTGIGALLLGVYEKDHFRYVGKVGTGFNQASLKLIKKELSEIEREKSPFDVKSPKGKGLHWVKPIKVCEVSFSQWTDEGVLRTPVFQGMREDKPSKEIHMEKAKRHLTLVKEISSPDKILFKKDKKTKEDVAKFYQKVADSMLPYVENRPLSLVRCPNGSSGHCFFQKHFTGKTPESFHTFEVKEEKGKGIYIAIDSAEGLQELTQLNAYEIHAWNTDKDDYMKPNQIVMDFDPGPGVPWKEVVNAAIELKEILSELDLESFVKVTGGKGLHVHIPVEPIYSWDQIKSFAQTLALEMVSRHPEKYVATMSKNLRRNKIFIDYLRNGYGATAVVPYSLRTREKSSVALPVEWAELKRIKSSDQFTMDKALKKIQTRKRDPWEGMNELKQRVNILKEIRKAA